MLCEKLKFDVSYVAKLCVQPRPVSLLLAKGQQFINGLLYAATEQFPRLALPCVTLANRS